MVNILVIGTTGMLGSTFIKVLGKSSFQVTEANRTGSAILSNNKIIQFDIESDHIKKLLKSAFEYDYIVNFSGLIKHKIEDDLSPFKINSSFPQQLAEFSHGVPIIQIGTDCVFSGETGDYSENSTRDASDLYGRSKIEGEVNSHNFLNLRCSVIGTERGTSFELLEWVRNAEPNATLSGYLNHYWNGLTTLAFSRIVVGIIEQNHFFCGTAHIVPSDFVTKAKLIRLIVEYFDRPDLTVLDSFDSKYVNRTLKTENSELNKKIWELGGYMDIPSIEDMIREYSEWIKGGNL